MVIGTLELQLRIDGSFSLKDKRRVLRSLLDRARHDFHVAIAEVGDNDLWNSSLVGVACVSSEAGHAESILQSVIDLVDSLPEIETEVCDKRVKRL